MAGARLLAQGEARRKDILRYLRTCFKKTGKYPTLAEIAREVGLRSPNATRNHLLRLEEEGYITITPNVAHGINLIGATGRRTAPDGWNARPKAKIAS